MKLNWFTRKGIIYLPVSIFGWLIFAAALAYAVYSFFAISYHSPSLSNTLINFVLNLLLIGMVYAIVAYFTERKPALRGE